MCGVFGRFAWSAPESDSEKLAPLIDLLRHRGPDGGGFWNHGPFFFGHRRLSILDLSEAGAQPMASADGRYVVTFNGLIYNYVELAEDLRAKGYQFRTRCDTEVLLHGYDAWGEGLLDRLTGMFAFAIADRTKGELLLARDRFGEKPLLYCEKNGAVVFASELAPISEYLAREGHRREIDLEGLAGYLCLNFVPGDRTLMHGVQRLPPGSMRKYGRSGLIAEREYYRPHAEPDVRVEQGDLRGVLHELRVRLDDAVRIALRADVPIALFLSGGIDSSLVAESAVRQGTLKAAFCIDIEAASFSEWNGAKHVADRLGLRLERIPLGPRILEEFLDIVAHADDPLADSSAVCVWQLARATAREFKVAVSGDGGDELFGGYLTYKATAIHRAVTSRLGVFRHALRAFAPRIRADETKVSTTYKMLRFLRAADLPAGKAHFTWNGAWLPTDAATLVSGDAAKSFALHALDELATRHAIGARPDLGALQEIDAREYLPNDILAKVDRMAMAHALESRAPFLNHHLASLAFAATPRFAQSIMHPPKRLLRMLADETFGPTVSRAKKQGFSIPVHAWLRHGKGRELALDLLSPASIRALGFLDENAVGRVRDRLLIGHEPLGFEVWGLCVLVAWHRARMVGSPRIERRERSPLKELAL